jgi:dUTP pyrophosphatase
MVHQELKLCLVHPEAQVPSYATKGSSAFDFYSVTEGFVRPNRPMVFDTGIVVEVPENMVLLLFPRSGHAFKYDVRLSNCVGVIDHDFRGEIKIKLTSDENSSLHIRQGDRIGQGILMAAPKVDFLVAVDVAELSETERGEGGFGSTGQ